MKSKLQFCLAVLLVISTIQLNAQQLHARWDELTAADWPKALVLSDSTCILPIGILEKHGLHDPIGTDLIQAREWCARAAKAEYAVVFPDYFYGQINEARHQPGTFSLPENVIFPLLEATCEEIARNGFKKIIIVNGHGGNTDFIPFFMETLLGKRRNYAIYWFQYRDDPEFKKQLAAVRKSDPSYDYHAGETETSGLLYTRPDLVEMENASKESGAPKKRLQLPGLYTPIWWYADFPNHYAGDGSKATLAFGKLYTEHYVGELVQAVREVKNDTKTLLLQKEYFDRVDALNK